MNGFGTDGERGVMKRMIYVMLALWVCPACETDSDTIGGDDDGLEACTDYSWEAASSALCLSADHAGLIDGAGCLARADEVKAECDGCYLTSMIEDCFLFFDGEDGIDRCGRWFASPCPGFILGAAGIDRPKN